MMNRATFLNAGVSPVLSGIALIVSGLGVMQAQLQLAREAAFASGGGHVQDNSVENVLGSERLDGYVIGAMVSAGLLPLFQAAQRLPVSGITVTPDLTAVMTAKITTGPLAEFSE
jgi:hypothetical protein